MLISEAVAIIESNTDGHMSEAKQLELINQFMRVLGEGVAVNQRAPLGYMVGAVLECDMGMRREP